jgi:hypothetical protein
MFIGLWHIETDELEFSTSVFGEGLKIWTKSSGKLRPSCMVYFHYSTLGICILLHIKVRGEILGVVRFLLTYIQGGFLLCCIAILTFHGYYVYSLLVVEHCELFDCLGTLSSQNLYQNFCIHSLADPYFT